jgi:hypothetical protein
MPRSLETLLYDPDVPDVVRELAEMGLDVAQEGVAAFIAGIEELANACHDWAAMERLARPDKPFYLACAAIAMLRRRDRPQLAPMVRDVADTLRIVHNLHTVPAR